MKRKCDFVECAVRSIVKNQDLKIEYTLRIETCLYALLVFGGDLNEMLQLVSSEYDRRDMYHWYNQLQFMNEYIYV